MFPGRQIVFIFSFLLTPLSGDVPGPVPGVPCRRQANRVPETGITVRCKAGPQSHTCLSTQYGPMHYWACSWKPATWLKRTWTSQLSQPSKEKTERRGLPSAESWELRKWIFRQLWTLVLLQGDLHIAQVLIVPDVLGLNSTLTESMDTVNLYF